MTQQVPDPPIRHVPMSEVVCYRLQKHELDKLSSGGSGSTMLAWCTAFASSGLSFLGCVLSGPILVTPASPPGAPPGVAYVPARVIVLIILACVSLVLGLVLGLFWWRLRDEVKTLLDEIHERERSAGTNLGSGAP